jgi:hypothetical protein
LYSYIKPSFLLSDQSPYHVPKTSKHLNSTWEDYLADFNGDVIVENFVHSRSVFNKNYEHNIIQWKGYISEVKNLEPTFGLSLFIDQPTANLMIKMEPSESFLYPDIALTVN